MWAVRSKTIVLAACLVAAAAAAATGGPSGGYSTSRSRVSSRPVGRLLPQLILVVRTAGDPAVARIAYDRARAIDPDDPQLRLAWSQRPAREAAAAATTRPAPPAAKAAAPAAGPASARGVATTLARQGRAIRARMRELKDHKDMLRDSIAGRGATDSSRRSHFSRYVIYGAYVGRRFGVFGHYRTGRRGRRSGLHIRIGR